MKALLNQNPVSRPRFIALLLALITLTVYLPVVRDSFSGFDDNQYVTENHIVQNGLTGDGIKWAFTTSRTGNWHPLTWISHMLDCELFGLNSGAQHYVNVLFHTANTVLLLLWLFQATRALWPSACIAALFAWHPLHVESVAWLSERKDVLSTFFEMLAFTAYVRYAQSNKVENMQSGEQPAFPTRVWEVPAHQPLYFWLAFICFALGLMAKPMLVTLPFLLLLLDYWPLNRLSISGKKFLAMRNLIFEKWPFFLLTTLSCIVTLWAQYRADMVNTVQQVPISLRLGNIFLNYLHYFGKTVWPFGLSLIYPFSHTLHWVGAIASVLFLGLVTWYAWRVRRRHAYFIVGWLWFLVALVPVIGFVQLVYQPVADRYTYVPLIGIFIITAFSVKDLTAHFKIGTIPVVTASGLILGICLFLTERQLGYWRNDVTLFSHCVSVTKNNSSAHINLGLTFVRQGSTDEALKQLREAIRIAPNNAAGHIFLGDVLATMGSTNEALSQCEAAEKVINLDAQQSTLRDLLGSVFMKLGQFDEAMDQYNQAARYHPDNPGLYCRMGALLFMRSDDAEAVDKVREALRLDPLNVPALTLLAEILASDDNPQIRNGAEAVKLAEKANSITGNNDVSVLDILAMSYAATGRFDKAQQIEEHAIRLAQDAGLETDNLNQRLKLYQLGRPYRE